MRALTIPLVASALLLAGCETPPKSTHDLIYAEMQNNALLYAEARGNDRMRGVNYEAADLLMRSYQPAATGNSPAGSAPFLVATLVNIDHLEQSSTLGRVVSEQISARLVQLGHNVIEMKVRQSVLMKRNEGEFLLGRDLKEVATAYKAQAVVVGTYAEGASFIYVSLKLIDPANSRVMAAYDYRLPLDTQIRSMMRKTAY